MPFQKLSANEQFYLILGKQVDMQYFGSSAADYRLQFCIDKQNVAC